MLLDAGKYEGAYYLAGYAMECALKACIAKRTNQDDFPPDRSYVQDCYTHDFVKLLNAATLRKQRDDDGDHDPDLGYNWRQVEDWRESSRYDRNSEAAARELCEAILDPKSGVLPWIKRYW